MSEVFPLDRELPSAAAAATEIVASLRRAGHQALLAGGCVRDLLLGAVPKDYDVATDAPPRRVCDLFKPTRQVGVQFGVVLVRRRGSWIEVATFRCDGAYLDGRRPVQVTFGDARHDAHRRDFTINGMFLDPIEMRVLDYVGGRADLAARLVRCIGEPAQRFAEDHLRLLRAVRFAARLQYAIEPATLAAMRAYADRLALVATERVRDELERMLGHSSRAAAFRLLAETGLLAHVWPKGRTSASAAGEWRTERIERAHTMLARLPEDAGFELALAILLAEQTPAAVHEVCRALTCANEQREGAAWLVEHQADLDEPNAIGLAPLKRLMAHAAFPELKAMAIARYADFTDAPVRSDALEARLGAIPADSVAPPPLVGGADLLSRGVRAGPIYKRVLDELYTRQLNEELRSREQAVAALDELLRRGAQP